MADDYFHAVHEAFNDLRRMSDEELDAAIAAARKAAHRRDNPLFNKFNLHADGTKEICNPCRGWAKDSAEWSRLCAERDRRRATLTAGKCDG